MIFHRCDCPECGKENETLFPERKEDYLFPLGRICDNCERLFMIDKEGKPHGLPNPFEKEVSI